MSLTASRVSRKPYTVRPLTVAHQPIAAQVAQPIDDLNAKCADLAKEIEMAESMVELRKIEARCNDLAEKLIAAGKTKSHDKLLGILEEKRGSFSSANPLRG